MFELKTTPMTKIRPECDACLYKNAVLHQWYQNWETNKTGNGNKFILHMRI